MMAAACETPSVPTTTGPSDTTPEQLEAILARRQAERTAQRPEPTAEEKLAAAERFKATCASRLAALRLSLGERYSRCRVANFEIYDDGKTPGGARQREMIDQLIARLETGSLATHVAAGRGVIFVGPVGTGKDHLAAALMTWLAGTRGAICKRVSAQNWFRMISDRSVTDEFFRSLIMPHVLTISDPVVAHGKLTDAHLRDLFALVDARADAGRSTWVTTNAKDRNQLADLIGSQTCSRLFGGAWVFQTNWPDYRARSAAK